MAYCVRYDQLPQNMVFLFLLVLTRIVTMDA
jgi:hypothetical protein